jgi:pimeloyl-ACP methyl ester carboxylesterase
MTSSADLTLNVVGTDAEWQEVEMASSVSSVLGKVTSRDGTSIAFERSGNGPTLVVVDGAMCSRQFGPSEATAAALNADFTVYRYDRRGRGDSTDTLPYAVAREVEDLEALVVEAGGSAFVYGISSGAGLALEAAASGVPITGLALFEPPYTAEGGDVPHAAEDAARLAKLLDAGRRGEAVELFFSWVGLPHEAVAQMKSSSVWPALEQIAPTIAYDNKVMGDDRVPRERAAQVTAPTIVIAGSLSSPELRRAAHEVANAIPQARHRTLEGQSHTAAPESIAPILSAFFLDTGHEV